MEVEENARYFYPSVNELTFLVPAQQTSRPSFFVSGPQRRVVVSDLRLRQRVDHIGHFV